MNYRLIFDEMHTVSFKVHIHKTLVESPRTGETHMPEEEQ